MATLHTILKPERDQALQELYGADYLLPTVGDEETIQHIFITAKRIVDASGATKMLQQWDAEDRNYKKRPGAKPWLSDTEILYLMVAISLSYNPPVFTQIAKLVGSVTLGDLHVLGIKYRPKITEAAFYARLYNSYRRMLSIINPYQGVSFYRNYTIEQWEYIQNNLDQDFFEQRKKRSHQLANALLQGSYSLLPLQKRREIEAKELDLVIDATHIEAAAQKEKNESQKASADPTAGYYKREGDHNGNDDTSRSNKYSRSKEILKWAYEVHTADMHIPNELSLIIGLAFDAPSKAIAENATIAIGSVLERGFKPGHLVGDRAYFPGTKPEKLVLPMRAKGFKLVFDYPKNRLGKQAEAEGTILVDGARYCPAMPQTLIDATHHYENRQKKDPNYVSEETYALQLKQREPYLLKLKEKPNQDGQVRYSCPAQGPHATVKCPLRTPDPKVANKALKPILKGDLSVGELQKICTQKSVRFSVTNGAKHEQEYPHHSPQWKRYYPLLRNVVESMNASLKNSAFLPIDNPRQRPRRGWTAQLLAVTLMILSTNTRQIINFAEKQAAQHFKDQLPKTRASRRTIVRGWVTEPSSNSPPLVEGASQAA